MEKEVQAMVPELKQLEAECHTTMCRYRWDAPEELDQKISEILSVLYMGSGGGPGGAHNEYVEMYAGGSFQAVPFEDTKTLFATMTTYRRNNLKQIRGDMQTQGLNMHRSVQPHEWPQE
jgi:hypothetical protein